MDANTTPENTPIELHSPCILQNCHSEFDSESLAIDHVDPFRLRRIPSRSNQQSRE